MAYYFECLDSLTVRDLFYKAGRAGHQIRNHTQGFVNGLFPEIQTIDTFSGQIEGECRLLLAEVAQKRDLKYALRNALRPARFLKKLTDSQDLPVYLTQVPDYDQIVKLINYMEAILTETDKRINKAIIDESEKSGLAVEILEAHTAYPDAAAVVDNKFGNGVKQIIADCSAVEQENEQRFKQKISNLGEVGSNCAHMMQELGGKWMHSHPQNTITNQIIEVGGAIENNARDLICRASLYGRIHRDKNLLMTQIRDNAHMIEERLAKIAELASAQESPVKLDQGSALHDLFQKESIIVESVMAVLKADFIAEEP